MLLRRLAPPASIVTCLLVLAQSTEDLEEVLSRRLQELPPPPVQASPSGSRELPEQRLPPDDPETLPDRVGCMVLAEQL